LDILLQIWGGCFYLANKVFFAFSETKVGKKRTQFKTTAWLAYLLGVPAWVILLVGQHDWIAASIEIGGVPAMLLGLYKTVYQTTVKNLIENSVKYITYLAIVFGVWVSLSHYGGINSITQILEIGVTVGFLMGSYLMAQDNSKGYFFFMLMNISMASLMYLQNHQILAIQQLISLAFVTYGYIQAKKGNGYRGKGIGKSS
jgi:hypothetical protein